MSDTEKKKAKTRYQRIWGLSKGLCEKEELYALIYRETGKEHMTDLTDYEISHIENVLCAMRGGYVQKAPQKRTDEGGNPQTVKLRRKIYMLTKELGWNSNNDRINAFCKKSCGVERIEWLSVRQCSNVIEGLKKIIERRDAGVCGVDEAK